MQVCLNHPVYDSYSGADFRRGLSAPRCAQALSFVRQRDGLPNGDLDRTHRQQAFIDSVIHQLRTGGVLSDLGRLQALLAVAKRYVITDAGWNLLDFAIQARGLTSGNLIFRTLPIKGYAVSRRPGRQPRQPRAHQDDRARRVLFHTRSSRAAPTGRRPPAADRAAP